MYTFLPVSFALALIFLQQGAPMTFASAHPVSTLEPVAMMLFPFSLVLMYGRMLRRIRHAVVIFSVMMALMVGTVVWAIYFDTLQPNPGLTAQTGDQTYEIPSATAPGGKRQVTIPSVAGLPVDQHLGNLEGKELRFGTSAGATFSALTVDVTDGAVNCEHDSLNPVAALSPMVGMWLNCIYGGKGVGMINLLLFLIVGVFVAERHQYVTILIKQHSVVSFNHPYLLRDLSADSLGNC